MGNYTAPLFFKVDNVKSPIAAITSRGKTGVKVGFGIAVRVVIRDNSVLSDKVQEELLIKLSFSRKVSQSYSLH
jgi:hypothetical protein